MDVGPNLEALKSALEEVPVFPLPDVVLFPRTALPLHVFEHRYRAMLQDCLAGSGVMVIARLLRQPPRSEDALPAFCTIASAGLVSEYRPYPDGRADIVVQGHVRVYLEELPFRAPYRRVRATVMEERPTPVPEAERASLLAVAHSLALEMQRREPRFRFQVPPHLAAGTLADLCANHLLPDAHVRQAILEDLDPRSRTQRVLREMASAGRVYRTRSERGYLN